LLSSFILKELVKKLHPLIAPAIVKGFAFFGTAQFPWEKKSLQVE
jgi:hypothetical protein